MTFTLQLVSKDAVTIDLGKVKAWGGNKDANLEILPMPGNNVDYVDSSTQGTIIFDSNGPTKNLTIESDLTGSFDTLNETIFKMEALIDGQQTQGTVHTLRSNYVVSDSEYGTTANTKDLNVKVSGFKHNWVLPGLNKVHFILQLIAGK